MSRVIEEWTYDYEFETESRDRVRFLVGDVDPARKLIDDREIEHAVEVQPNEQLAAATLADMLCGVFAQAANVSVGQVKKDFGGVAEQFCAKAMQLRREACKRAGVSFPAITRAGKEALEQDDSLTKPQFCLAQFDNPFASQLKDNFDKFGFNGL